MAEPCLTNTFFVIPRPYTDDHLPCSQLGHLDNDGTCSLPCTKLASCRKSMLDIVKHITMYQSDMASFKGFPFIPTIRNADLFFSSLCRGLYEVPSFHACSCGSSGVNVCSLPRNRLHLHRHLEVLQHLQFGICGCACVPLASLPVWRVCHLLGNESHSESGCLGAVFEARKTY